MSLLVKAVPLPSASQLLVAGGPDGVRGAADKLVGRAVETGATRTATCVCSSRSQTSRLPSALATYMTAAAAPQSRQHHSNAAGKQGYGCQQPGRELLHAPRTYCTGGGGDSKSGFLLLLLKS